MEAKRRTDASCRTKTLKRGRAEEASLEYDLRPSELRKRRIVEVEGGGGVFIIPGYTAYPIASVEAEKDDEEEEGLTLYKVLYRMPNCPGQPWLSAEDVVLYGGKKELDAFLLSANNLLPNGSGLTEAKAEVERLLAVLASLPRSSEKTRALLAQATMMKADLAAIPTAPDMKGLKRVRKGQGQTENTRARNMAKAEFNVSQKMRLAALDEDWRRLRVAIATSEHYSTIRDQLATIAVAATASSKQKK